MRMSISKVNFFYGAKQVLFDIGMGIATNKVTCSWPLWLWQVHSASHPQPHARTVRGARLEGEILLDGPGHPPARHRPSPRVWHGLSASQPFPQVHFDNVAYGLRINGSKLPISEAVEKKLRHGRPLAEVKDHLHKSGLRTFRRPAAAPLHCARPGRRA